MSEVKVERYSPFEDAYSRAGMVPDDEGEYVEHSDYAALAKRVEELELVDWRQIGEQNNRLVPRVHRLEAENKRLREALTAAAIPLEALFSTECDSDGTALSPEMKLEVVNAVTVARQALRADITTQSGDSGTKGQHLSVSADNSEQGE